MPDSDKTPLLRTEADVDAVIRQAIAENWAELHLEAPGDSDPEFDHAYRIGDAARAGLCEKVARIRSLDRLVLAGLEIDYSAVQALGRLTGLQVLRLYGNRIGDAGAQALSNMTAMTWLDLDNNQIGDAGAQALGNLTALTRLHLDGNQIGDTGAQALSSMTALTRLDLDNNQIGDAGAQALSNLTALTVLSLNNNQIGHEGVQALENLTTLQQLALGNNQIGDAGAQALGNMTALTWLNLNRNRIGDAGAQALGNLTALTDLYLVSNQIGDAGAQALLETWSESPGQRSILDLRQSPAPILSDMPDATDFDTIHEWWMAKRDAEARDEGANPVTHPEPPEQRPSTFQVRVVDGRVEETPRHDTPVSHEAHRQFRQHTLEFINSILDADLLSNHSPFLQQRITSFRDLLTQEEGEPNALLLGAAGLALILQIRTPNDALGDDVRGALENLTVLIDQLLLNLPEWQRHRDATDDAAEPLPDAAQTGLLDRLSTAIVASLDVVSEGLAKRLETAWYAWRTLFSADDARTAWRDARTSLNNVLGTAAQLALTVWTDDTSTRVKRGIDGALRLFADGLAWLADTSLIRDYRAFHWLGRMIEYAQEKLRDHGDGG